MKTSRYRDRQPLSTDGQCSPTADVAPIADMSLPSISRHSEEPPARLTTCPLAQVRSEANINAALHTGLWLVSISIGCPRCLRTRLKHRIHISEGAHEPIPVVNMIVYTCSEQASATSGAALRVEGGLVRFVA